MVYCFEGGDNFLFLGGRDMRMCLWSLELGIVLKC